MRYAFLLGLSLLIAAPAQATGGFDCWTADRRIVLTGSFGNWHGNPMDAAFLQIGDRRLSTAGDRPDIVIVRSWLDEEEVRVDLGDRDYRVVWRWRGRWTDNGAGRGTLRWNGETHPIRCEMERMDL